MIKRLLKRQIAIITSVTLLLSGVSVPIHAGSEFEEGTDEEVDYNGEESYGYELEESEYLSDDENLYEGDDFFIEEEYYPDEENSEYDEIYDDSEEYSDDDLTTDILATDNPEEIDNIESPDIEESTDQIEDNGDTLSAAEEAMNYGNIGSGSCGDNVVWNLEEAVDGTMSLSIHGTGDITSNPWKDYRKSITSVTINKGITGICNSAFENCTSLEALYLPNGLISIGENAFYNCPLITELNLPDSVEYIGSAAFYKCGSIANDITIPKRVKEIGDSTFAYCNSLPSITFPEGLTTIGIDAFFRCISLKEIVFPFSFEDLKEGAFNNCWNLKKITFNGDFCITDHMIYNIFSGVEATAYYPSDNSTWTSEVLLDYGGVITWIPVLPQGLADKSHIIKMIPADKEQEVDTIERKSVTVEFDQEVKPNTGFIYLYNFDTNTLLQKISVQDEEHVKYQGNQVDILFDLPNATTCTVFFDKRCFTIGGLYFWGILNEGEWTFRTKSENFKYVLENIQFPIDTYQFTNSPEGIGVNLGNRYPRYNDDTWNAFFRDGGFSASDIYKGINWKFTGVCAGMMSLWTQYYYNEYSPNNGILRSMDKPANNHEISDLIGTNQSVFQGLSLYRFYQNNFSDTVPQEKAVEYLFNKMIKIQETQRPIYLDYGYITNADEYRTGLLNGKSQGVGAHVVIAYGIETVGAPYEFNGENYAYRVLTLNPNHLYSENDIAENSCIYISGDKKRALIPRDGINSHSSNCTLVFNPAGFTSTGDAFFQLITDEFEKIVPRGSIVHDDAYVLDLQNGIIKINGESVFKNATSKEWLKCVTIPPTGETNAASIIIEKGDYDLSVYEGTVGIDLGDHYLELSSDPGVDAVIRDDSISVHSDNTYSFDLISNVAINSEKACLSVEGNNDITVSFTDEGIALSSDHLNAVSINTSDVMKTNVERIDISDETKEIVINDSDILYSGECGENLTWELSKFATNDYKLTINGSGEMSNYHTVSDIPWNSYAGNISKVELSSDLTSIGFAAFFGCSNLTNIILPSGVTRIGDSAFSGCSSLTSIVIPSSVISIGFYAFKNCSNLKSIEIPSGITNIKSETFSGCSSLTNIILPAGVTSIGTDAFFNCSSLTSIKIPMGVTSIERSTFQACSRLTNIEMPSSLTSIGFCAFLGCDSLFNIEIPSGVTSIDSGAFEKCQKLQSVLFKGDACDIGWDAFSLDNAIALYPEDNETWTDDVKKDYKGTLIWIPYDADGKVSLVNTDLSISDQTYSGSQLTPSPIVSLGKIVLYPGTDYDVSYKNNINVGTATVTITGKGNYKGTITRSFKINPRSLKNADISGIVDRKYIGETLIQNPIVKLSGKTLVLDQDYYLAYKNNTYVGKATIAIKGMGNYGNVAVRYFNVKPVSLTKATITGIVSKVYTGSALTQKPVVKLNGKTLKLDTDYYLAYKNNINSGRATIAIKGKGNYTGVAVKYFAINPKPSWIAKLTSPKTKQIKITWGKRTQISGYQIEISTNKTFAKPKQQKNVYDPKKLSLTVSVAKARTTYYVRIRSFKKTKEKTYFSTWSAVKKITAK